MSSWDRGRPPARGLLPSLQDQPGLHPAHRPGAGHAGLRRQEAAEGEEGQEELSQFSLLQFEFNVLQISNILGIPLKPD